MNKPENTQTSSHDRFQAYVKVGQGWRSKSTPSIVIRVEEMIGGGSIRAVVAQHADSHEVGADRYMTQSALKANYDFVGDTPDPIATFPVDVTKSPLSSINAAIARSSALADLSLTITGQRQDLRLHLKDTATSTWCGRFAGTDLPIYGPFPTHLHEHLCERCARWNVADGGQDWQGMRSLVILAEKILKAEPAQLRSGWILLDHERRTFDAVTIVDADSSQDVLVRYGDLSPEQELALAALGNREFYADARNLAFEVPAALPAYLRR